MSRVLLEALRKRLRQDAILSSKAEHQRHSLIFPDFRNQVQESSFLLEVTQSHRRMNVFGIDVAVSIMDGADLSEHRRKELAEDRVSGSGGIRNR